MSRWSFLAVACALFVAVAAASAEEASIGPLTVRSAWSRATPGGATVGVGYLAIENKGATADRLIGVSSLIAGKAEIHETTSEGGVARMRPVDGVEIPAGAGVELKPGGLHLMFMELRRPLKEGQRFTATLRFEKAGAARVDFIVRGIGAKQDAHHSH
jgi:copper(I)-binding protein